MGWNNTKWKPDFKHFYNKEIKDNYIIDLLKLKKFLFELTWKPLLDKLFSVKCIIYIWVFLKNVSKSDFLQTNQSSIKITVTPTILKVTFFLTLVNCWKLLNIIKQRMLTTFSNRSRKKAGFELTVHNSLFPSHLQKLQVYNSKYITNCEW